MEKKLFTALAAAVMSVAMSMTALATVDAAALAEENAKTAKTFFQVVKRFEKFSLVSLVIETGRTHQIRFHMASIGCPLLGDSFYGDGPELGISRTALHAQQLTFTHPFCEKVMRIESEMPKDLTFLLG